MTPEAHGLHDARTTHPSHPSHTTLDGWTTAAQHDGHGHAPGAGVVIPSDERARTLFPALLHEIPFGLLVIDVGGQEGGGVILEMNRAAERLLGVSRHGLALGGAPAFVDLVAGDGAALLRDLRDIGAGHSSRFAFRRRAPGVDGVDGVDRVDGVDGFSEVAGVDGVDPVIHGWACRVELPPWSLVYCALLRPDSDLAGGEHGSREPVGYAEDITEQRAQLALMRESERRARARAAELEMAAVRLSVADRRKDEFLARLAHELRNPLAPIRIWTQRLLGAAETPPLVRHASEVVDRQVRHLTRLVEDLLEVSRFVWGKVALRQEPVALGEAVELAVQMAQPLIEERRHELTLALGTDVVWVRGDLARLVEIFHNLLDNAAKYTPASGHIRLTLSVQPPEAVVVVKDDGIGIDPEFMPRVFDLFSRGPHAEQLPAGGLGLGLSLVHQMVLAHGGTVCARSGGAGQGSEFEVRLPLADAPERAVRVRPAAEHAGGAHHDILVVDDNHDGAEALASYLKDLGHRVEVAADGHAGLALAERMRPQFVLLDIGMPGMDGHELARRLRAEPWAGTVVLLAISGYDSEDDRQRSLAAGCDEHLVKPVDPEAILDLLARYGASGRGPQPAEARPGSEQHG
jgi:signal transduction histidine kinase/CheY-like chemotaxis protein